LDAAVTGGGLHRDAIGAWTTIGRDPIGILVPAATALAVEAALIVGVRSFAVSLVSVAGLVVAAVIVRLIVQAPVRAAMIAAAARAQDVPAEAGIGRTLTLLAVDAIRGLLAVVAAAIVGVPLGAGAMWLASRDLFLFAALVASTGLVLSALVGLLARATVAYAAPEAVVGGLGPVAALREGWAEGQGDWPQLALLLLAGDVAVGLGGALCGAGALPGYPIGDVAVLHRWARRRGR
jgi:hypothetical protein